MTSSESIASTAHVLLLRLDNGTVWNPAVLDAGSAAASALLASLAAADDEGRAGETEANGWRAQLQAAGGLSSVGIALSRNDSGAATAAAECAAGCPVLQLTVPQLVGYQIAADERLRLRISGRAVGLDGNGAEAVGEPSVHIVAERYDWRLSKPLKGQKLQDHRQWMQVWQNLSIYPVHSPDDYLC